MGGGPKEGSSKKEDFKKQYKILDASRLQFLSYKHGLAKGKSDVELGRGAFGVVKRALFDGKIEVAVKSLIPPKDGVGANSNSTIQQYTASKGDALKLFIEEAKTMRQVDDHPQIVKFIGYIFETSSIVMEYVPGGSLYDYIHQNIDKMTWKQKYIIAKDVALGMAFLHSKTGPDGKPKVDVFHQDLKSSNVLLYHDETLQLRGKISDFGLSVVRTKIVQHSQRGKSLAGKSFGGKTTNIMSAVDHKGGTPEYMAPELETSSQFTKSCDVYSCGVIFFEMITMLTPLMAIQLVKVPESDQMGHSDLSKDIMEIAKKCLGSVPEERPRFKLIASKLQEAIQAKLSLFQEAAEDQESDNRILFEVDDTVKKFIISSSMAGRPAMTFSENYNLSNDFGRQQRAAESRDDPNDKPGRRCPCFGV